MSSTPVSRSALAMIVVHVALIGMQRLEAHQPVTFELRDGDRVVLLGDALIEREQEHGYLETALTVAWPNRGITFRNLGWTGDNPRGEARRGFGSAENTKSWKPPQKTDPDYGFQRLVEQVQAESPTVIFLGYGASAAFENAAVEAFATELDQLLDELHKTKARLVILSPIRHANMGLPLPDPALRNSRLERVCGILREASQRRGHLFVDLFHDVVPVEALPRSQWLTDDGLHLNSRGYRRLAEVIAQQLRIPLAPWRLHVAARESSISGQHIKAVDLKPTPYGVRFVATAERLLALGETPVLRVTDLPEGRYSLSIDAERVLRASSVEWAEGRKLEEGGDLEQVDRLRRAVVEKNRLFFYHFRPQNEAYIFLFRRHERGDHAAEIAQFERLAEEKEKEIFRMRVPSGRQYELVLEKSYPQDEVPRSVDAPDPEKELKEFKIVNGFEVSLFAANPLIAKPININWDAAGRTYVATSTTYPHLAPGERPDDKIIVLEDIDHDGRADKSTVFADGLIVPHSVIPGDGGVYVTQSTELLYLADSDGDGRADIRRVLLAGFGNADVHHMIHGLRWGPGGELYFTQSIYINSRVETPWGVRQLNASGVWRFQPESMRLDVYCRGLTNPWGLAIDRWGQSLATDGAGGGGPAYVFPGAIHSNAAGAGRSLPTLNPGHPKACGLELLSGRHLPDGWQGVAITTDFRASRVVGYRLSEDGSAYSSRPLGDVLTSSHRSFRPVDIKMGPDGAVYVVDWYNPIIDHGEVDFHHPLRDVSHGRIWRMTAKGKPVVRPPILEDAPVEQLLAALSAPEDWTRGQARRLLKERGTAAVMPILERWLERLDRGEADFEHHRLEALWVCQSLGAVRADLLDALLSSPDHHARAAAVRVLARWLKDVPDGVRRLGVAVEDDHPQVRLEAVNALRDVGTLESVELAMRVLHRPLDTYLEFAAWLTVRERRNQWLPALERGGVVFRGDSREISFALAAVEDSAALRLLADLYRKGQILEAERMGVLRHLALLGESEEVALVLAEAVHDASGQPGRASALLSLLEEASVRGRPVPGNAVQVLALIGSADEPGRAPAAKLAGAWKVSEARQVLTQMAGDLALGKPLRHAACQGLALMGDKESLQTLAGLSGRGRPPELRETAVAAWASADAGAAAQSAVDLLTEMSDDVDPSLVLSALLERNEGAAALTTALEDSKLSETIAAVGVRLAESSGRAMPELIRALRKAGSLSVPDERLAPGAVSALLADIDSHGDPFRGEMIFRRAAFSCQKCHAIGGSGGQVGPDLASVGGSATPAHLLESMLDPSAKIKEGFQSVTVVKNNGAVLVGTVQRRSITEIVLRDAQDTVQTIPMSSVQEISPNTVSLMPSGLTAGVQRDELVDLIKFLSVLGRDERFRLSARREVRHWEVLLDSELARKWLAGSGGLQGALGDVQTAWQPVFGTVGGQLPLADIPELRVGKKRVGLLRFQVEVSQPGPVDFRVTNQQGLTMWVGHPLRPVRPGNAVELESGPQTVAVQVDLEVRQDPVQIELVDVPGSGARARLAGPARSP